MIKSSDTVVTLLEVRDGQGREHRCFSVFLENCGQEAYEEG
jgi:hypothetical protein